jgi:MFS family permease
VATSLPRDVQAAAPERLPDEASAPVLTAWLVFATAGLFVFYQLILQSLPSVIREGLVVDFSLTNAGFGSLSASFYYPYILLQVPAGLLVMRFGPRRLLMTGLVLCILACFVTAFSRELGYVTAARILMGLGAAPTFVASVALAARWFPPRFFPMLVAVTETIGMLGAAVGQETLGFAVERAGWRAGMTLCAGFGVLVLAMTFLVVRDAPRSEQPRLAASRPPLRHVAKIMLAPALILSGLVGGMINTAGLSFAMLWGVPFLEQHLGVGLATASFCASFYSWGIIIGLPLFGWACGNLASPVRLLAFGALSTGAAVALILYAPPSLVVAPLGMFFCGLFSGSYAVSFVIAKSSVADADVGTAIAYANMLMIGIGGLVLQPLIGLLADLRGQAVTDPAVLSILLWAQVLGLILIVPLRRFVPGDTAARVAGRNA